jgi:zinc protease
LTYYIRRSLNPTGQAEFFIIHNVGSLQENDDQRGLAHFWNTWLSMEQKTFPKKVCLNISIGLVFSLATI